MDDGFEDVIVRLALQNASEHGGKTSDKIILGRAMGAIPELRGRIQEIAPKISEIVSKVNSMPAEEQLRQLRQYQSDVPAAPEKKQDGVGLPALLGAERGKVVTRFPPEPNGYPHIGHAKAAIINAEYARMYDGKCILRMDDTNPEAERMEYHAAIKVGLEWLGVEFDIIKSTSDDIEILHEKGTELVRAGNAYVCTCKRDNISKNRRERRACKCSASHEEKNRDNWEKMFQKFKPGEAILRFRGDMASDNAVMRDPVLFRIIDEKHYVLGDRYRVWPSYDLAVSIEDSVDGVTHAFRSKEFEARADLIDAILGCLGMRKPVQGFFSRLELAGMPTSKRILKPLIEDGRVPWYDDPRLATLEALKRRGIRPEAVRKFVMSLGLTKADTIAPFDALEAFNRKIIDPESTRLFMVGTPRRMAISGIPVHTVEVPNHPASSMGTRTIPVDGSVLIDGADADAMMPGSSLRLLGLGNVRIIDAGDTIHGEFIGGDPEEGMLKIQWVPERDAHSIKVIVPKPLFIGEEFDPESLQEAQVSVEPHYRSLKDGTEIQFVRFGYCRKDSEKQAIFTHR